MNNKHALFGLLLVAFFASFADAQETKPALQTEVQSEQAKDVTLDLYMINSRLNDLESTQRKIIDASTDWGLLFLFGAFCALWAQNTGRRAGLWFVAGFIFNFIAVFVLLYKNAVDVSRANEAKVSTA